ncbi:predicted protein [Histoplasma capsulatum var. duboisii H88]|uniref:Predicted protein n=1 Tax=Ajellomyces capsulatus (strain H88) TaxID=544711 RepID=F0UEI6_AJEC8|nr:predicted protein [Histoplasma capsulatum var. duboisii H88]
MTDGTVAVACLLFLSFLIFRQAGGSANQQQICFIRRKVKTSLFLVTDPRARCGGEVIRKRSRRVKAEKGEGKEGWERRGGEIERLIAGSWLLKLDIAGRRGG